MQVDQRLSALASPFARVALANIAREYPNKLDHVMNDAADVRAPGALHPAFYGSYDWHSCVHMHWMLARLLRLFPSLPEAPQIHSAFRAHLTSTAIHAEIAYLLEPSRQSFERTYGWAWLLKLQVELGRLAQSDARAETWHSALQALADLLVERFLHFLPMAHFPVRAGTHANSAFGLLFALDYAEFDHHLALRKLIEQKAHAWFGGDRRYPAAYEPGGDDFLSGGLMEAALMQRILDTGSFAEWWEVFCPPAGELTAWLTPVPVTNRADPKFSHLDGLNLSRAWCWTMLMADLPTPLQVPIQKAVATHLAAAIPHATSGDYVGTHWLASFAVLALTSGA